MITSTSDMTGRASSGMRRSAQIPASTSRKVPVKTRKRLRAHASIHREITLHPSRGVHIQLLAGDRLSVLSREDCYLPSSAASQLARSLVNTVSFIAEGDGNTHCCHAHRWHGWHGKCDGYFCAGNERPICVCESHAKNVASLVRRAWIRTEFDIRPRSIDNRRCARTGRRRNKGAERGLKLAFRVDKKISGGDDALARLQSFQNLKVVFDARAQLNVTRFQITIATIHKNNLASTGLQNATCGEYKLSAHWNLKVYVDEHAWFQQKSRIGKHNAHVCRPRVHVYLRINKIHASCESPAWVRIHSERGGIADF